MATSTSIRPGERGLSCHMLGCGSPVSYRFVYAISADICGEADRGGLARQRQGFKTYRKSTAQVMVVVVLVPSGAVFRCSTQTL